jgi:hypothetical protein
MKCPGPLAGTKCEARKMIDDDVKTKALNLLPIIIQDMNSILTTDSETDEPFLIVEDWNELGTIQRELNKQMRPRAYYRNVIDYYNIQGNEAFQRMRFEKNNRYILPTGLFELDNIINWGFAGEHITCSNCYRSISLTPGYYGHQPRYVILNAEILCGDCINNNYEEDYIEYVMNNPENAIATSIVSEDRLAELGWKKLSKTYNAGIREGNNDKPMDVYNKLKTKWDVLFTFESGQFDLDFWAWIKKSMPDNVNL